MDDTDRERLNSWLSGAPLGLRAFVARKASPVLFVLASQLEQAERAGPSLGLRAFDPQKPPLEAFVAEGERISPTHIKRSEGSHVDDVGILCAQGHDLHRAIKAYEQRANNS